MLFTHCTLIYVLREQIQNLGANIQPHTSCPNGLIKIQNLKKPILLHGANGMECKK